MNETPEEYADRLYSEAFGGATIRPSRGVEAHAPLIDAAAKRHGLDASLLRRVIQQESGGNPRAVSPVGAKGLMQLMPACLSVDALCLTSDGWRAWNELSVDSSILTYSLERECLEWQPLQAVHYYADPGALVRMRNSSFDFTATPNHKWVIKRPWSNAPPDLRETQAIRCASPYLITRTAPYTAPLDPALPDAWVFLAGLIFADGSIGKGGRQIDLYQKEKVGLFQETVEAAGFRSAVPRAAAFGMSRWCLTGPLAQAISACLLEGGKKRLPASFLFSLTTPQLELLWKALLATDAWKYVNGWEGFSQSDLDRAKDLQLLVYLRGHLSELNCARESGTTRFYGVERNTQPKWQALVRRRTTTSANIHRLRYEDVPSEPVWCPSVSNQTWVAWSRGHVSITGNTASGLGVRDSFDPAQNIEGGARYLRQQLDAFGGDVRLALAAYNSGPQNVRKHKGVPPFKETQDYVQRIAGAATPNAAININETPEAYADRLYREAFPVERVEAPAAPNRSRRPLAPVVQPPVRAGQAPVVIPPPGRGPVPQSPAEFAALQAARPGTRVATEARARGEVFGPVAPGESRYLQTPHPNDALYPKQTPAQIARDKEAYKRLDREKQQLRQGIPVANDPLTLPAKDLEERIRGPQVWDWQKGRTVRRRTGAELVLETFSRSTVEQEEAIREGIRAKQRNGELPLPPLVKSDAEAKQLQALEKLAARYGNEIAPFRPRIGPSVSGDPNEGGVTAAYEQAAEAAKNAGRWKDFGKWVSNQGVKLTPYQKDAAKSLAKVREIQYRAQEGMLNAVTRDAIGNVADFVIGAATGGGGGLVKSAIRGSLAGGASSAAQEAVYQTGQKGTLGQKAEKVVGAVAPGLLLGGAGDLAVGALGRGIGAAGRKITKEADALAGDLLARPGKPKPKSGIIEGPPIRQTGEPPSRIPAATAAAVRNRVPEPAPTTRGKVVGKRPVAPVEAPTPVEAPKPKVRTQSVIDAGRAEARAEVAAMRAAAPVETPAPVVTAPKPRAKRGATPTVEVSPAVVAPLERAARVIVEKGNASSSTLQRELKIGYTEAAGLIDKLEARGIVGPLGDGQRAIHATPETLGAMLRGTAPAEAPGKPAQKLPSPVEAAPAVPARRPSEGPAATKNKIGDPVRVAQVDSVLVDQQTIDGVRYEIYSGASLKEKRAAVRVVDEDSGNVVSNRQYADYEAATRDYTETVERQGGKVPGIARPKGTVATTAPPAVTPPTPKPRAKKPTTAAPAALSKDAEAFAQQVAESQRGGGVWSQQRIREEFGRGKGLAGVKPAEVAAIERRAATLVASPAKVGNTVPDATTLGRLGSSKTGTAPTNRPRRSQSPPAQGAGRVWTPDPEGADAGRFAIHDPDKRPRFAVRNEAPLTPDDTDDLIAVASRMGKDPHSPTPGTPDDWDELAGRIGEDRFNRAFERMADRDFHDASDFFFARHAADAESSMRRGFAKEASEETVDGPGLLARVRNDALAVTREGHRQFQVDESGRSGLEPSRLDTLYDHLNTPGRSEKLYDTPTGKHSLKAMIYDLHTVPNDAFTMDKARSATAARTPQERTALRSARTAKARAIVEKGKADARAEIAALPALRPRGKGKSAGAVLDPKAIAAYGKLVSWEVADGALTAADFAERMVREFGEEIRPHLRAIWKAAQTHWDENRARFGADDEDWAAATGARVSPATKAAAATPEVPAEGPVPATPSKPPAAPVPPKKAPAASESAPAAVAGPSRDALTPETFAKDIPSPQAKDQTTRRVGLAFNLLNEMHANGDLKMPPVRGASMGPEEWFARGKQQFEAGVDPVGRLARIERDNLGMTPDDAGLMQYHVAREARGIAEMQVELDTLSGAARKALQEDLLKKQQAQVDFIDSFRRLGSSSWHNFGRAMQATASPLTGDYAGPIGRKQAENEIAQIWSGATDGKLTEAHRKEIEDLADVISKQDEEITRLRQQTATSTQQDARETASGTVAGRRGPRRSKEVLAKERAAIVADLKGLLKEAAPPVRLGSGVPQLEPQDVRRLIETAPEISQKVGALAKNLWEDGAGTLQELVDKTLDAIGRPKNVTFDDVVDAFNAATPHASRTRSDAEKLRLRVKAEADVFSRLQSKIEAGGVTTPEEKRVLSRYSARTKDLQQEVKGLKRTAREVEVERLIAEERAALAKGEALTRKAAGQEPPSRLKQLQAERQALRSHRLLLGDIADLEEQLRTGAFRERPKQTPLHLREDRELVDAMLKRALLVREVQRRAQDIAPKNLYQRLGHLYNSMRSLNSSLDDSALGRQGWRIAIANPDIAVRAWMKAKVTMNSELETARFYQDLQRRPMSPLARRAKLYLADQDEHFPTHLFANWKKNNPFAMSERAFNTFLNDLRMNAFERMVRSAGATDDETIGKIAQYINVATGRGLTGTSLENAAGALSNVFFSPRNLFAGWEYAGLRPYWGGTSASKKAVAKQYARTLGGVGALTGLWWAAAQLLGDQEPVVEGDTSSVHFGQLRVPNTNTWLDFTGGMAQIPRTLRRVVHGETKNDSGEKRTGMHLEEAGKYLKYKLHPGISTIATLITEKDAIGRPRPRSEAWWRLPWSFAPLTVQELAEAGVEDGLAPVDAWHLLSGFGFNVQSFTDPGGGRYPSDAAGKELTRLQKFHERPEEQLTTSHSIDGRTYKAEMKLTPPEKKEFSQIRRAALLEGASRTVALEAYQKGSEELRKKLLTADMRRATEAAKSALLLRGSLAGRLVPVTE